MTPAFEQHRGPLLWPHNGNGNYSMVCNALRRRVLRPLHRPCSESRSCSIGFSSATQCHSRSKAVIVVVAILASFLHHTPSRTPLPVFGQALHTSVLTLTMVTRLDGCLVDCICIWACSGACICICVWLLGWLDVWLCIRCRLSTPEYLGRAKI